MYRACIIVLSDREYTGEQEDSFGRKLEEYMKNNNFDIIVYKIIPEVKSIYRDFMIKCCDNYSVDLVVTIGNVDLSEEVAKEISNEEDVILSCYRRKKTIIKNIKENSDSINVKLEEIVQSVEEV